ncbi:MAG: hypothetical protein EA349_14425 [Halomonadaceae bacterium]|nr:MAG: hypothetical protein EA349_14425 [Halomonadaceae bacterium]
MAMEPLDEESMAQVAGQAGMSISGDVFINEDGGPINNASFGDCTDNRRCGARLASQFSEDGGWWVLDDFRGRFQFDGLTLRVRHIDSGFAGDGAEFNRSVLEIGLPGTISMEEVRYSVGTSTTPRPTDPGFQQTNFYSVHMEGDMRLEGNALVFPTGNP